MPKPAYTERIQWSPNYSTRNVAGIKYGAIHTQQGNGTADSLANYLCQKASGVSYHYTVDNNRTVVCVVDTDDSSWSVGNGNPQVINVCFAGSFAEWTRAEWLAKMGNGIEIAAYLQVMDAQKYHFDPVVRGWDDLKAGKKGLTDHRGINIGVLRAAGHTDVGDNFPWDVYIGHVNRFAAGDVAPVPNVSEIEQTRAANEFLGKKITAERELPTPDGKGRYAHYENGSIYWTPDTRPGFAVPLSIRNYWSDKGWETSYLGYPTKPHLILVPFDHSNGSHVDGGTVQHFQGGTVYSRNDARETTFVLRGEIKKRYGSLGFETGPLGWPTSDEYVEATTGDSYGIVRQDFEWGTIRWINQGGSTIAFSSVDGKVLLPFR